MKKIKLWLLLAGLLIVAAWIWGQTRRQPVEVLVWNQGDGYVVATFQINASCDSGGCQYYCVYYDGSRYPTHTTGWFSWNAGDTTQDEWIYVPTSATVTDVYIAHVDYGDCFHG